MEKLIKQKKGITLIALVITVIVLLILAGIALASITGENGILNKSKKAGYEHEWQQAREEIILAINSAKMAQESQNGASFRSVIGTELSKVENNTYSPNKQEEINTAETITGTNKGKYGYTINLDSGEITNQTKENQEIADTPEDPDPPTPPQGGDYDPAKGVNTPKLFDGMIPIKWDSENSTWVICEEDDPEWYNYVDQTGTNDGQSMWANVMLSDGTYKAGSVQVGQTVSKTQLGSMYVWIPRYAYSITSLYHQSSTSGGDVKIAFLEGTKAYPVGTSISYKYQGTSGTGNITNKTGQGNWNEHPAFNFGGTTLSGIWVAKFEASNNSNKVKVAPDTSSWRSITVNDIFNRCREMQSTTNAPTYGISTDTNIIDTHMMKNSEWGAVAYLTQSSYGRNKHEVTISGDGYVTGGGNYVSNANQSTTGNVTGIYDMSGGAYEYVAGYVNNGNSILTSYGSSLVNANAKYKDVYSKGSSDSHSSNYTANSSKYGDAVYETSSQGTSMYSWYSDYSSFPSTYDPFFYRGGGYDNGSYAGLFFFSDNYGYDDSAYSFRPVLVAF